jgi:homoserine kinase
MQQITVRVPASTSNLGPGFDCLGIALRMYNTITIERDASHGQLHPAIVSEAADGFFKQARHRAFSFSCSIMEQIPRSRGLGGSATIRLGVLFALNRLSGSPLDRFAIFELCSQLEKHPDNAAPAIFGGFTVVRSARRADWTPRRGTHTSNPDACPTVHSFSVSPRLHFVLFIPEMEIQTARARKILPSTISHAEAIENSANACTLTAAFASQDYGKLRGAFADHLHQPFRTKLIPFLPRVIAVAEQAGALGAFLSGSGSTMAAVTLRAQKSIATAMARAAKIPGRTIITQADNRGAKILTSHRSLSPMTFPHGPPA